MEAGSEARGWTGGWVRDQGMEWRLGQRLEDGIEVGSKGRGWDRGWIKGQGMG